MMKERNYKLFKAQDFSSICPTDYWNQLHNNDSFRTTKQKWQ